jgi:ribosomal protein S17
VVGGVLLKVTTQAGMVPRTALTSRLSFLFLPPMSAASPAHLVATTTSNVPSFSLVRCAGTSTARSSANQQPPPPPAVAQPTQPQPQLHPTPRTAVKLGTVISAGLMDRTVRVLHRHTTYDKHLRKLYPAKTTFMVSDPRNSLREGDVIEFSSGWRASKNVRHVVERIVAPFGIGVDERPAVMSREERERQQLEEGRTVPATMGKIKSRVLSRLRMEGSSSQQTTATTATRS